MTRATSNSNVSSGFVDMASYDAIEKYLYGGCYAVTPFVRDTVKATWFTQVPAKLTSTKSTTESGGEFSASISRVGDYLLNNWLRVCTPEIYLVRNRFSENATENAKTNNLYRISASKWDAAIAAAETAWLPFAACGGRVGACPEVSVRWTRNLMHNMVEKVNISFNELVQTSFTSHFFDFWAALTVPQSKRQGYDNMIGNTDDLTNPLALDALQLGPTGSAAGVAYCGTTIGPSANANIERHLHPDDISADYGGLNSIGCLTGPLTGGTGFIIAPPLKGTYLPSRVLNLPLPLPHTRDSGVSLPTAALPYNDMKINVTLRKFSELLIGDVYDASTGNANIPPFPGWSFNVDSAVDSVLKFPAAPEVWGTYALVSNAERSRMGCHPRDILIEQQQETTKALPDAATSLQVDVRFSHSIKALFWAFENTTLTGDHSNYTASTGVPQPDGVLFSPFYGVDPIDQTKLTYENTERMDMGTDYYSHVTQFYNAPVIAQETGYHLYSYALDFFCLDPLGSTNYGKLSNVSLTFNVSEAAQRTAAASVTGSRASATQNNTTAVGAVRLNSSNQFLPGDWLWGNQMRNQFKAVVVGLNYQIIRVSGGTLGFGLL